MRHSCYYKFVYTWFAFSMIRFRLTTVCFTRATAFSHPTLRVLFLPGDHFCSVTASTVTVPTTPHALVPLLLFLLILFALSFVVPVRLFLFRCSFTHFCWYAIILRRPVMLNNVVRCLFARFHRVPALPHAQVVRFLQVAFCAFAVLRTAPDCSLYLVCWVVLLMCLIHLLPPFYLIGLVCVVSGCVWCAARAAATWRVLTLDTIICLHFTLTLPCLSPSSMTSVGCSFPSGVLGFCVVCFVRACLLRVPLRCCWVAFRSVRCGYGDCSGVCLSPPPRSHFYPRFFFVFHFLFYAFSAVCTFCVSRYRLRWMHWHMHLHVFSLLSRVLFDDASNTIHTVALLLMRLLVPADLRVVRCLTGDDSPAIRCCV